MDAFIGTILIWPMSWAPDQWAQCNGAIIQVQQNQALYSLIGNIYGGSGTVTMGIPDLRGRSPIGMNLNSGATPYVTLGTTVGISAVTLSPNNLPVHNHPANFLPVISTQPITIPAVPAAGTLSVNVGATVNTTTAGAAAPASGASVYLGGVGGKAGASTVAFTGPYDTTKATTTANLQGLSGSVTPSANYTPGSPAATVGISAVTGGSVTVGPGGGVASPLPFNNYQPSMTLNFIIALTGLYPVRS